MKNYKLLMILSSLMLLASCTSKEVILQEENGLLPLPTQTIEVKNYENTGIDFIIEPVKSTLAHDAKSTLSDSTQTDNDSLYIYDIATYYPKEDKPVLTRLAIKLNDDGSMTSTHFLGTQELATLKFNNQGKLLDVIIPEENNFKGTNAVNAATYDCINKEYHKLKSMIEDDWLNALTCSLTRPFCESMIVMSAIEICRGNVSY